MKLLKPVLGTHNRLLILNVGLQIMNRLVLKFSVLNKAVLMYKIIDFIVLRVYLM